MHPFLIIDRIISLFTIPQHEWIKINKENTPYQTLYLYIILPLLILGIFTLLTGNYFVKFAFIESLLYLTTISVIIWLTAFFIDRTSQFFNSKKDFNAAFTLVSYSFIPLLLANIPANLALFFYWMSLFGFFGIYLFWIGLEPLLNTPSGKKFPQLCLVLIFVFVLMILSSYLLMLVKSIF